MGLPDDHTAPGASPQPAPPTAQEHPRPLPPMPLYTFTEPTPEQRKEIARTRFMVQVMLLAFVVGAASAFAVSAIK